MRYGTNLLRGCSTSIGIKSTSMHVLLAMACSAPAFGVPEPPEPLSVSTALLQAGGRSSAGPLTIYAVIGPAVEFTASTAGSLQELSSWFPCVGGCTGDLTQDGLVNSADLGLLIGAWGTDGSIVEGSDLNGDGIVDAADLGLLVGAWGPCS